MNELLAQRLRYGAVLPTPPATALIIIELANAPDTGLIQIADCIGFDPALSAKILKAANSPLNVTRRTAANLRQAVSLMGTNAAITIALSFSLVRSLNREDEVRFWKRSILSALACRTLAERFGFNPDDLLLAGLLQDIGILALRAVAPDEYAELGDIADHEELLRAEKTRFGSGHDEVGYWLLKKWRLPDHFVLACIASHATPSANETVPNSAACVALSGYFAEVFLQPEDTSLTCMATHASHR